jgi:ADP-L-glycero-D-manno-heptose 6-epimerase
VPTTSPMDDRSTIIVTGGAGFVGSNLVRGLNQRGETNILVVDDLSDGHKFTNIVDCDISDYLDLDTFLDRIIKDDHFGGVKALFHQGACSTTTEWDGKMMMNNNFEYSKTLLDYCDRNTIPFIYASSAAVYGDAKAFSEDRKNETPLNVYGYSKFLFDQFVRRATPKLNTQVVGLRYFNVYGPGENHKGSMASVAYHFNNQIKKADKCRLFEGSDGYINGEQRRDFIYVGDLVKVNCWFLDNPDKSGIFNLGTGKSQSFNEVANAVIKWHGHGEIQYIPFPEGLKEAYQSFTEADMSLLRQAGYDGGFSSVKEGVPSYLDYLNKGVLPTYF